jgi:hypothetical protein
MIWKNYELENTILKVNESMTLWKTESGIIEIDKNTLLVPIKLDDERKGCIFHGHGKLLLDTIVETEDGAFGEPVEQEMNGPFLMLGETEEIQKNSSVADKRDLESIGYESEEEFVTKAKDLFDKFLGKRIMHDLDCCRGNSQGLIFASPNEYGKFDVLIAKGHKIVYKAKDKVFVSNRDKVILKTPSEVIMSNDRRSMVLKCKHCH